MVHAEVHTLHEPDGSPVCNVSFDLSAEQVAGAEHAIAEVVLERHRGQDLEIDDVLRLRELTGVRDELARLAEGGGHAHVVLPLARFSTMHDAVDEYVTSRTDRDWARKADKDALPLLRAMLGPMAALRGEAVEATLRSQTTSG